MSIENTSRRDKLGLLGDMLVHGSDKTIEDMEAQGQRDVCGQVDALPSLASERDIEALEAAGVKFGDLVDGDPLWRRVEVPRGWKIEPTPHPMWSALKDQNGAVRGRIFYKAAFYDRRAHLYAAVRYDICFGEDKAKEESWYQVVDRKTGQVLIAYPPIHDGEAGFDEQYEAARQWLAEHFPGADSPAAYWEEA